MTSSSLSLAALAGAALIGCQAADAPVPTATPASSSSSRIAPKPPEATLAAMDRRTPVPLLPMMAHHQKENMRDHLVAVQEIATAVATEDFEAVRVAVGRIGYSEQMGRMCQHMGAGAPGFTDLALKFHHAADKIGEAAEKRDTNGVVKALSTTLAVCTTCHQAYKQQVVDEIAWAALTKSPSPTGATSH